MLENKNSLAFAPKPKISKKNQHNNQKKNNKGCSCKKSQCLKKYCECYNLGRICSRYCKCSDCSNCSKEEGIKN